MIDEAAHGALTAFAEVKVGQDGREVGTPDPGNFEGLATQGHVTRRGATDQAELLLGRGSNPSLAGCEQTQDAGVRIDQGNSN